MIANSLKQNYFGYLRALFFATILSILSTLISGCNSIAPADKREDRSIGDLIHFLNKCGLKPEAIQPVRFEALRASDGCIIYIGGARVEVYIYDISDPIQKRKLEKIRKNNSIIILSRKISVAINRGFVMLTYSTHPKKAEIVRAFKRFPIGYKIENLDDK